MENSLCSQSSVSNFLYLSKIKPKSPNSIEGGFESYCALSLSLSLSPSRELIHEEEDNPQVHCSYNSRWLKYVCFEHHMYIAMSFSFLDNVPWFRPLSKKDVASTRISTTMLIQPPKQRAHIDIKFWQWPIFSIIPWAINARNKFQMPATVNQKLKSRSRSRERAEQRNSIRFRPYVSKVPWHTGPRGFLSQLFPRYGHYCGPNWSSGKDNGSPIWDKRPIDWLDFCCYCHDIGYDSHDQAELLKADIAFLECLEKPHMSTKGDPHIATLYKTMCTSGLRNILIPYRQQLVKLQSGELSHQFGWLSGVKWKWPKLQNA